MVVLSSRINGFGRLLLLPKELLAGRAGTLQLARIPLFSTVPSPTMPPLLDDELLLDELLEEELVLDDELLEDEELVLEDELLLEELLLDEVLELVPPQAAIAVVSNATEQY